jgi:ABC-type amino acid transport system permease subunit
VDASFQRSQQALWAAPPCRDAVDPDAAGCLLPPVDLALAPTRWAAPLQRLTDAIGRTLGVTVSLPMLQTEVGLSLFLRGLGYSLALVGGAVVATLAAALAFGAALAAGPRALRWPAAALRAAAQSTPLMLLMVCAGVVLSTLGVATPATALLAAVLVLGLFNGSNAGQAIAESLAGLRGGSRLVAMRAAVGQSRAQVMAFVVNAVRGSPAASVIGVPELLASQTDIASFSGERTTTFALLLLFYLALVSLVAWAGDRLLARWDPAAAGPAPAAAGRGRGG